MKVVSLLPGATEIICELGMADSIVAVSEDCNWPPAIRNKPVVARCSQDLSGLSAAAIDEAVSQAAAEGTPMYVVDDAMLAALAPDLVVTQDVCAVCAVSSGDLTSVCPAGAEIYSMNPRRLEQVITSVTDLAGRLAVESRGRELAARMRDDISRVTAAIGRRRPPRVFLAEWVDPPYGCGHWLPDMVEAAGGEPIAGAAGEYSFATTWDAVLAENPELVVVAACGFNLEQSRARCGSLNLPVRTVLVDGDAYFTRSGPRLVDGIQLLAHLLHPDAVPDPGLSFAELSAVT